MDRMLETLALIGGMIGMATGTAGAGRASSARAGEPAAQGSAWVGKTQGELDKLCKQVADVAGTGDLPRRPFIVTNLSEAVERLQIQRAVLGPSGVLDVFVDVVQSAQPGALYLNLGGSQLDLGDQTSSFVMRIEGKLGARSLSFSSGTAMQTIAAAINSFARAVGLTACASASGVTIRCPRPGSAGFTSVRILNDGGVQAVSSQVGIYQMLATNAGQPDPSSGVAMNSTQAAFRVVDPGQDIRASINGWMLNGEGTIVGINTPQLKLRVDLASGPLGPGMVANAQNLGYFRAFTLMRRP